MIVEQSNLYAEQVMPPQKFTEWEKITVADYEAFVGFGIKMAINKLPAIHQYWSDDITYRYRPVADRIFRDRYQEISRYLHYAGNTTLHPRTSSLYDRLGKVRPLLQKLQERFSSVYTPGRNLAVDEAMIKFQGRSSLKQYMPKKPIKHGIKVWVLGDSSNGYFSRLGLMEGRNTIWVPELSRTSQRTSLTFGTWSTLTIFLLRRHSSVTLRQSRSTVVALHGKIGRAFHSN